MTEPKKGASDPTEPIIVRRPSPAEKGSEMAEGKAAEIAAAPSGPVASPEETAAPEPPDSTPDQPTSMPSNPLAGGQSPAPPEGEAAASAPTSGQASGVAPGEGGADIRRAGRPKHLDKPRDDFASLLARQGPRQTVEQGTIVKGELVAISKPWVFVDLGAKTEGVLALEEILDEDGNPQFGIGDQIEAFVASTRRGEIRLSRRLGKAIRDQELLFDAFENGVPVEGRVKATNKGGFEVTLAGRRAFCPISQIDVEYTEDPGVHVGKTYRFRIVEMSPDGKRLVVSRAALLREERKRQREELIDHLVPGIDVDGVVTSLQDYGAFVDLGGLEGLVHISELSWGRVEHPSEVVKEGQEVMVRVLDMKETDKGLRISLSLRQTAPHPWVAVGTKFVEGESYPGKVTRLEPYGAFVELGPGLEGLVHISEITWDRRLQHPKEVLSLGQPVDVYIKSIDYDRERLSLSLKALEKDPWSDADQRYPAGSTVKGEVEKIQPFGIFVRVEPGLTALIPASESGTGSGEDLRRAFTPGQEIAATVLNVEPERRRMSLSLKAAHEAKETADLKRYMEKQEDTENKGSFGTLGDLFGDKLRR